MLNKFLKFYILFNKYFFLPFCLSIFLISFLIYYLKLELIIFYNSFYLYIGIIFGFLTIFLLYKNFIKKNKIINYFIDFLSPFFSSSLFIITILKFNFFYKFYIPLINNNIFIILLILFGFLIFYKNQNNLIEKGYKKIRIQKKLNKKRNNKFFKYYIEILIIIIISCGVYIYNIGNYSFQGDEYYHAQITKNFFENNKLFSLDDGSYYTRSKLTSILPIISKYIFNIFNINASDEFIYRFPIIIISILSALFIFLISKKYSEKKYAILITLIFITDVWFIYFARFLRFYSPTLFFQLFIIYILIINNNIKIKYLLIFISLLLYFYLQTYFILILGYIFILLLIDLFKNKKYLNILIYIFLILTFVIWQFIIMRSNLGSSYNEAKISLNLENIYKQINWLLDNYYIFIILFITSIMIFWRNKIYIYTMLSFLFFVFYINNAEFNFTFRPVYFFLPLMMIFSIISITYIIKNKYLKYFYIIFLLFINIYQIIKFPANFSEECFYPTKLIYEKSPCITSEKELFNFIDKYTLENKIEKENIYFLGMGSANYYFQLKNENILNYANNKGKLSDFESIIINNQGKNLIFVATQNAFPLENMIQKKYFNRDFASEISTSVVRAIEDNKNTKIIYETNKKLSKIYLLKN